MEGKKQQVDDPQKILMVPMIAHGHATPFFELAKKLSKANFHIYLCSTSAVLSFLKQSQEKYFSDVSNTNIELVELHLPSMPDLPSHYQSTKGLPNHLYPPLFTAYKMAGESFSIIVNNLSPDLIIEDFFQAWAPDIALSKNIPIVSFSVVSAASYSFMYHIYLSDGATDDYPFPEICLSNNEIEIGLVSKPTGSSITVFMEKILVYSARKKSCDIVLINNWKETEVKYMQYLSSIINKKTLSVGPLIGQTDESTQDDQDSDIIEWLDKRDPFSTVYAVFGSENVWSKENIQEIAHGIELSNVNFLWVLRFPGSEVEQVLPEGFLNRVKERGMVVSRWVPHAKIMRHKSIGGFLNHCGWNSTVECIHFGVPLIAMPFNMDQFITANYAVELGMALKVQRDEKGGLKREEIAKAIRNVIMEKKMGEELRETSKELSEKIRIKEEKEIDQEVVEELRNLCLMNKKEKSI
ncbi:UDP-glucosyltransferase 29-like [Nicotiana tabacum]|uniref:UDP-glucosyltransferase 29-like n=2 Tax=Nicotiana TaxID=4085 RepID=A0A1S4CHN0_TOBAC|nr:PREDICTED: cyanidin-3-O-glucoside 2-O-glucuronosyltransferase-like [Nicotiana sylvestris]WIW42917.1 UDP-glycosyltransferase [Nicotiana tabacum]